ncbi:MAG TPA: VWA domain-containing protein [Bacteroidales bacterium]|nr:VWA domain-containing protein [Bacteroidales bacterium]HPM92917.1 VWA domain-containing protein [Bacteroidales bacterium]
MIRILLMTWLIMIGTVAAFAQKTQKTDPVQDSKPVTRILFVFDASQSMYGRWQSDLKINIARDILLKVLDSLRPMPNLEVALRLYGHQHRFPPQVCDDSKLEVPFAKDNYDKIRLKLKDVIPRGTSPIAASLEQAAGDFPPCENCRNVIVLITDGIEECGGDPCQASYTLQKSGIALRPFIIGIGANFEKAFDCVGIYLDASSEEKFSNALHIVVSRIMNPTTCQVNLLDANNRPTETNIGMTFYDHSSGKIKYNIVHTLNSYGQPDTLNIDPMVTYDIVVHTIPPVRADSVRLVPGRHTVIPVNVPQGILLLKMNSQNTNLKDITTIVRKEGRSETINTQEIDQQEKYITGTYNIEVLSLPRLYRNNVDIIQSHTTTVEIPVPGIAVIQKPVKGFGSLFLEKDGELELIYNFKDNDMGQESLVLMPGNYRAVFRSRYAYRSAFTIERAFEVKSGTTTNVKLQD